MQVMHTHMSVLHTVYIPIQAKANYPTMVYLPSMQEIIPSMQEIIPSMQEIIPSMLLQVYLPKQILKATE